VFNAPKDRGLPDVVTAQIILGIPLLVLYVLSIGIAWLVERMRKDDHPVEAT